MTLARNVFVCISVVVACSVIFLTLEMFKDESRTLFTRQCPEDHRKKETDSNLNFPRQDISHLQLTIQQKSVESSTDPLKSSAICRESVFLAIVVASAPNGFTRRNSIRGSWGIHSSRENPEKKLVKIVFLIGHSKDSKLMGLVERENEIYGDIVFGAFQEDYRNLTYKTRLGLKWAYFHCQADYFLKTDDDVFINVIPLIRWLKNKPRNKFYSGWCNFNSPVVRDPNNKWYVSKDDYDVETYPGYCLGGGYIMSTDVLKRIITTSYKRKLFPMEDLYVGFMVKDLSDVTPKDNKQGFNLVFGGVQGCAYNNLYLAHPVEPENQLKMLLEAQVAQRTC